MANEAHFLVFPFFAQGHMIPMVDIAKLLAQHGATVTIVSTPQNTKRYATTLARARESGLKVETLEVPFPCHEAGFPKDCEIFDMLPSLGLSKDYFKVCGMLREPVENRLEQLNLKPSCIISDLWFPYTVHISRKYSIPRISFNGFSCFCFLCLHNIRFSGLLQKLCSEPFSFKFTVPGIPHHIELTRGQLPSSTFPSSKDFADQIMDAEMSSYGNIFNSFDELEEPYVEMYKEVRKGKVWCVGPVSLCNRDAIDKTRGGSKSGIDESKILNWLDTHEKGTVVYACFGSLCNVGTPQLIELALGLEASNKPFIWVLRDGENSQGLKNWLAEDGFEDRVRGRGLVIIGWAPQVVILSHPKIGGFLTHCGWNSTLEGITAGKPMVTWPLFGDQFCNEKFIIEVLKIGVKVGAEVTYRWGLEDQIEVPVKREDVKNAINALMGDEYREDRLKRINELSKYAKSALLEGGSSYCNMELFIKDIIEQNKHAQN